MTDASPRSDPRITQALSFQLLVAVNRLTRPFPEAIGRPNDLALPDWRCMMALAAWPDSSGEDVARAMGMDRMSVSRSLRSLERRGRAARQPDPANRKRQRWRMTDAGWDLFDRLLPEALARDAQAFGGLSAEERRHLADALSGVLDWESTGGR